MNYISYQLRSEKEVRTYLKRQRNQFRGSPFGRAAIERTKFT